MTNPKKRLINLAIVLASSVVVALLMAGLDGGGTRWIKFVGYVILFASIISPSLLFPSSSSSCSIMSRLRKRS